MDKERRKEIQRRYRERNHDRIAARERERRKLNLDRVRLLAREWARARYTTDPVYREKEKAKARERQRKLRLQDPDKARAQALEWRKNNPERYREVRRKHYLKAKECKAIVMRQWPSVWPKKPRIPKPMTEARKQRRRTKDRQYNLRNVEKRRESRKLYVARNKERLRESRKRREQRDAIILALRRSDHRKAKGDEIRAKERVWYRDNSEKACARSGQYAKTHRSLINARVQKARVVVAESYARRVLREQLKRWGLPAVELNEAAVSVKREQVKLYRLLKEK